MKERLEQIKAEAIRQINESEALDKLNDVRVSFLGKKGDLKGHEGRGARGQTEGRTACQ